MASGPPLDATGCLRKTPLDETSIEESEQSCSTTAEPPICEHVREGGIEFCLDIRTFGIAFPPGKSRSVLSALFTQRSNFPL
jgi:hypothetical protein